MEKANHLFFERFLWLNSLVKIETYSIVLFGRQLLRSYLQEIIIK